MALDRRQFLAAGAVSLMPFPAKADGDGPIPLWPGSPPGGGGPQGPVAVARNGAESNIAIPTIERVVPARPNGSAMLVAGGGGYRRIEIGGEARPAATWLAERGITAFLLRYRLPGEGWAAGPMAPLQDAQRALRLIRRRSADFGIDARRIGGLGFSAGGHLIGLAAAWPDAAAYPPVDAVDRQQDALALAALIYPVVTLKPPYDHTSTQRVLVGQHPDPALTATWSVETHVRPGMPPLFLVQAEDDPISDPQNTRILAAACAAACAAAGDPVEMHRLASGGHGFGMGKAATPSAAWPDWFEAWLKRRGWL